MSDCITIELTDAQLDAIDWLMGVPAIENWGDTRNNRELADWGCDHDKPVLDRATQTWTIPDDPKFIEHILMNRSSDLERLKGMGREAAETTPQDAAATTRVVNNIQAKVATASDTYNQ